MSDWSDGLPTDWTNGFDLSGGGDTPPDLSVWQGQTPTGFGAGNPGATQPGTITDPNLLSLLAGSGAPGAGGGAGGLASLLRSLGLTNGSGDPNMMALLSMLAPLLGGAMSRSATGKATDQMAGAIKDANAQATSILGGAGNLFAPYTSAGAGAAAKAAAMNFMPLASRFGPLHGPGATATLGRLMR